ncbi:unnamed protein product [Urochloa decumbens]|uniref:Uncharacterized protein n=1 Tax=Urochloa decumbens TaxID=240449 RepID=A0ABC8VVT5_9POAL
MSSKVQTMASRLYDASRPRRFDLTMSRRTRRPASLAASCHQEDHVAMEGFQTMTQLPHQVQDYKLNAAPPSQCLCLSDHLQSQHSEAAEGEECQDNSRSYCSLQELIQDETTVDGGQEEDPAADAVVQGVEKRPEQAAGRKVIGMMRRYVRVRSVKTKHVPEKNVPPIC